MKKKRCGRSYRVCCRHVCVYVVCIFDRTGRRRVVFLVQPRPMLPLWVTDDPGNPQQVRRYFVDTSIYRPTITPPTCSSGVEPRGSATAVATPYDKQVSSCGTFNSTFVVYTSVGAASWLTLMASVMREQHATETEVCVPKFVYGLDV